MRSAVFALAALTGAALIGGCSKAPSPVGKWTGTMQGQTLLVEYKEDKTMVAIPQGATAAMQLKLEGTWSLEGDKMTQTLTKFDAPGLPPQFKKMAEDQMKSVLNKPQKSTVKFDGETMTQTGEKGESSTLTRVKEEAAK